MDSCLRGVAAHTRYQGGKPRFKKLQVKVVPRGGWQTNTDTIGSAQKPCEGFYAGSSTSLPSPPPNSVPMPDFLTEKAVSDAGQTNKEKVECEGEGVAPSQSWLRRRTLVTCFKIKARGGEKHGEDGGSSLHYGFLVVRLLIHLLMFITFFSAGRNIAVHDGDKYSSR